MEIKFDPINNKRYLHRSKILREKGTNRKDFMDGKINKYEWVDLGSSFIPSELFIMIPPKGACNLLLIFEYILKELKVSKASTSHCVVRFA